MLQRYLLFILMLDIIAVKLTNAHVYNSHRDQNYVALSEVSSCIELRNALCSGDALTRIQLKKNLTCSERDWGAPVSLAGDRVLQGQKTIDNLLSIHLDLSSIKQGIKLPDQRKLAFKNLVIHIDQEDSMIDSGLSFVQVLGQNTVLYICESVIMSHSCLEFSNNSFSPLPSTSSSSSQLLTEQNNTEFANNLTQFLSGTFESLNTCNCWLCCYHGEETPVTITINDDQSDGESCLGHEMTLQKSSTPSESQGRNKKRRVISISLVCFFFVFFVVLGLILYKRRSRCNHADKNYSKTKREEEDSPSNSERTRGGVKSEPYIVKLGDISIDTSQELGTGGFGTVYEGTYQGQIAAIKVIRMEAVETEGSNGDKESRISESLTHPNVVQTYNAQTVRAREIFGDYRANGDDICKVIAMEYCDKGELSRAIDKGEYVLSFDSLQPNMSAILHSALDIAKGLEYLHSLGIVHGDLKPDNVLCKSVDVHPRGSICKICDFGLSRRVGDILAETDTLGMISYMPPELLRMGYVGRFTDIYSFGMLLWEMATSDVPFSEVDYNQIVLETVNGRRPQIPDSTPSTLLNLINSCWDSEYAIRPTATQVIQQLKKAISEWYSSFPTCSITIPNKTKQTSSDDYRALGFLTTSVERFHDLAGKSEWSMRKISQKKLKPSLKERSYYEVHKQVLVASAPSIVCSPRETPAITPIKNEQMLVPPLFPYRSKKSPSTEIIAESELTNTSPDQDVICQDHSTPPLEGKKQKDNVSANDLSSLVSNSTPRSMLAGPSGYLKNNRNSSVSLSGKDNYSLSVK
eukprot:g1116.t1